jgi:hypothetical protein
VFDKSYILLHVFKTRLRYWQGASASPPFFL